MKKIQVGFLMSYDYELLKKSIPPVYELADTIFLALDHQKRTWSGNHFEVDPSFYEWLEKFDVKKKIVIYEVNDKKYCQVINWWKYQYELSDMEMSRFPAPEGWTDCWNHAHSFDGKSSQSGSWINRMKDGGFQKSNVRQ